MVYFGIGGAATAGIPNESVHYDYMMAGTAAINCVSLHVCCAYILCMHWLN